MSQRISLTLAIYESKECIYCKALRQTFERSMGPIQDMLKVATEGLVKFQVEFRPLKQTMRGAPVLQFESDFFDLDAPEIHGLPKAMQDGKEVGPFMANGSVHPLVFDKLMALLFLGKHASPGKYLVNGPPLPFLNSKFMTNSFGMAKIYRETREASMKVVKEHRDVLDKYRRT